MKKMGLRGPNIGRGGTNPTSKKIDYTSMMNELYEWAGKQGKEPMSKLAELHGFTLQRLYLCKNRPILGANVIRKLKTAGVNVNAFILD